MEKNQILVWLLALVSFSFSAEIFAKEAQLSTYGKYQYVEAKDFLQHFEDVSLELNSKILIGRVYSKDRKLDFRVGGSFFTNKGLVERISRPILFQKNKLYFPPDFVEAILLNIVPYEIQYEFRDNQLVLIQKEKTTSDSSFASPIPVISESIPPSVSSSSKSFPLKTIVIDAGHGGKDPGTHDEKGVNEKAVTLSVAKLLQKALAKRFPQVNVIMTRSDDTFIALEERSRIANRTLTKTRDSIFISLHCNSSLSDKANGFEIYYLSQTASSEEARELSLLENKILASSYPTTVQKIQAGMLSSLIQRRSRLLADSMEEAFSKGVGDQIPSRGVKKADFAVLRGSLMPAILIELGYLSHPKEAEIIRSKEMRIRFTKSIVEGIIGYANSKD